ncbi:alkaline phosphatase PhoX, partial [Acinetobacter baumannii]|uniref:alkaline phosphatase PhoX n=2 Tax=Pseudomonadota TaxID=1224 RepID=UPI00331EC0F9
KDKLFKALATDWVEIEVPDPDSESAGASNRAQGYAKGAARFTRGEGCWWGNGKVYFVCSNGGDAGRGQIFAYDPEDGTVTLFVESVASSN